MIIPTSSSDVNSVKFILVYSLESLIASQKLLSTVFTIPVNSFLRSEWTVKKSWLVILNQKFVFAPNDSILIIDDRFIRIVVQKANFVGQIDYQWLIWSQPWSSDSWCVLTIKSIIFAKGCLGECSQHLFVCQFNKKNNIGNIVNKLVRIGRRKLIKFENEFSLLYW